MNAATIARTLLEDGEDIDPKAWVMTNMPGEKEVLARLGFEYIPAWDCWHRRISHGRWAYHEPPRYIQVDNATKYERGNQFQYHVTLMVYYDDAYNATNQEFVCDIFSLESKLTRAIKVWADWKRGTPAPVFEDEEDIDPKAYAMGFTTRRQAFERAITIQDNGVRPRIEWNRSLHWQAWLISIVTGKQVDVDAALRTAGINKFTKLRGSRGRVKNWAQWYVYLDKKEPGPEQLVRTHEP